MEYLPAIERGVWLSADPHAVADHLTATELFLPCPGS